MCCDTAVILAGGKSLRLGFDKQLIHVNDMPIAQYIAKQIEDMFKQIIIVTNRPDLYRGLQYEVIEDRFKEYGAIAGLYEGLKYSQHSNMYIIGCDMPVIKREYIRYMQNIMDKDNSVDAVITRYKKHMIEPLNGFYSQSAIPVIEEMISNGRKKISQLLKQINTYYVSENIAREYSPQWEMFLNINTREDLQLAEKVTKHNYYFLTK